MPVLPAIKFQDVDEGDPRCRLSQHYSAQASYFAAFRGIRDTKIEKSRGIQDKISL